MEPQSNWEPLHFTIQKPLPTLQRTFLLKFSLSFFLKKIKNEPNSLREREREREIIFFFSIYIFSGVVFGQFLIVPTPKN